MAYLITKKISEEKFRKIIEDKTMIKMAVDIERRVLSLDCEFHIDCAERLMADGSKFSNIWGANFYPEDKKIDFIALINIRPEKNRSMEIQDEKITEKIEGIIKKLLPI